MSGFLGILLASGPGIQCSYSANRANVSPTAGTYSVSITLVNDGTATASGGSGSFSASWVNTPYTGVGSLVWVQFGTPSGGGTFSLTPGTWYSLSSSVPATIHNTTTTVEYTGNIALTFALDSGGVSVIGSGNFAYDVGQTH